jgi:hypothetical protein
MSFVQEALVRERLAEVHRTAARVRAARVLRARHRAEIAARRAEAAVLRAERLAVEVEIAETRVADEEALDREVTAV